ncbi:MAG: hypothetical protein AAB354_04910 [candidate division KSB1 bacterium]
MEQDSPWKEVLEDLFEEFLEFFFPEVHRDLDLSKGYEFLDKELQQILVESETGARVVDKLVRVYLRDGSESWLLIHIEIQGYAQEEFPERMYVYNYRIFDGFQKEVVSLALLTDDDMRFRPSEYQRSRWGFGVRCWFPVVKLIDYRARWPELEASEHPFALVTRAFLKTLEVEGNAQETYSWKKTFLLALYHLGLSREAVRTLYKFVDWIMRLPKEMNEALYYELKTIEENKAMPYITTAERIGMEKGMEKGMKTVITKMLKTKFGEDGRSLAERAALMQGLSTLEELSEKILLAQSISEAESFFHEIELRLS